ncbi:MAG: hypothetical protein LBU90_00420 [Bacteroidales bacterium]|jgi:LysM repeat protein|nr:hypothetical protein [Bacteroidales bacterium]
MRRKIIVLLLVVWNGALVAQKPAYTETMVSRPPQTVNSPVELLVQPEVKEAKHEKSQEQNAEKTSEKKQKQIASATSVDAAQNKLVVTTLFADIPEGVIRTESDPEDSTAAPVKQGKKPERLAISNATLVEYIISNTDYKDITIENSTIYSLVIINSTAQFFTINGPVNISKLTIKNSFINDVFFENAMISELQIENTDIMTFVTENTVIKSQSIITTSTATGAGGR